MMCTLEDCLPLELKEHQSGKELPMASVKHDL